MYIVLLAFIVEAVVGYPQFIYTAISHPVVWIGSLIAYLEKNCNNFQRSTGVFAMLVLLIITLSISFLIIRYTHPIVQFLCMVSLFSMGSLYQHVKEVLEPLIEDNLEGAQKNLAKIVGRDVQNLDEGEVSKAAIESLAESFCDGVVAPVFFAVFFGLAGLAGYKAISTADSMIGHKTKRYLAFGWAAAKLDDICNFIPARISALLIIIASFSGAKPAWRTMWLDARKHASPNSGFPEAAMAGALGICLGGVRNYDGESYNVPLIGEEFLGSPLMVVGIKSLEQALRIYVRACFLLGFIVLILAVYL
jgi:adenosylcobinamide-phosphate synthase